MLKDSIWVKSAFLAPSAGNPRNAATFTTASTKFVDTRPGGNFALNNPPQHSPLADPRIKGRLPGSGGRPMSSSAGLGMSYSERIDDNSHLIYMRFGHASFSSIGSFVSNIFDYSASLMATTGRKPGFFYAAGYAAGIVTQLPFLGYIMFAKGLALVYNALVDGSTSSNYMSVKPAMHEFWGSVSWVYNSIGVSRELVWPFSVEQPEAAGAVAGNMAALAPDIVSPSGLVDIFSVALRGQRLANEQRKNILTVVDSVGDSPDAMFSQLRDMSLSEIDTSSASASYEEYLGLYTALPTNTPVGGEEAGKDDALSRKDFEKTWWETVSDMSADFSGDMGSAMTDGADWLCLRVNHQADHKIALTNTTKANPLADKVNGVQQKVKDAHYALAGGNLGDNPLADLAESTITAGKEFLAGTAAAWGVSGMAMLMSGAYADIPNIWDGSEGEINATTYTIDLDIPSGNAWAEYLHIMPTVCALMAAALPISTGKYSYNAPFYCELYDSSRAQMRRALVTSVSIERGTHDVGMTRDRRPLGCKIEFTVTPLDGACHMPLDPNDAVWDGDSAFSDLLAVLGGADIYSQFYQYPKLKMKLKKSAVQLEQSFSTAQAAMGFRNTLTGRTINSFMRMGSYR